MRVLLAAVAAIGLLGCGEELSIEQTEPAPEHIETSASGSVLNTAVQALDEEAWVHVNLADTAEAGSESAWDLRFRRIAAELGDGVEAQMIEGDAAAFLEFSTAEAGGAWVPEPPADAEPVGQGRPGGPLGAWFDYNPVSHVVSPGDRFFAVRMGDGRCFKLRFTGYYDDAGTAGVVSFDWAPIEGCR